MNLFVPIVDNVSLHNGSSEIAGAIPDAIAGYLGILQVIAVAAVALWMFYRICKNQECDRFRCLAMMSLLVIMVFIAFSKVYSGQYMLWILAIIPFVFIDHHEDSRLTKNVFVFGILSLLSSAMAFSIGIHTDSAIPVLIVLAKNISHVVLMVLLFKIFIDSTPLKSETIKKGTA